LQRLHPGTYDMDRDTLKRHLTKVEEQVAIVAQNVTRQRELVAELERDGYDATQAKKMLEQFVQQQALHIADRDRLIKELSELPPSL
jgi:arginine repressor